MLKHWSLQKSNKDAYAVFEGYYLYFTVLYKWQQMYYIYPIHSFVHAELKGSQATDALCQFLCCESQHQFYYKIKGHNNPAEQDNLQQITSCCRTPKLILFNGALMGSSMFGAWQAPSNGNSWRGGTPKTTQFWWKRLDEILTFS